ncbi:cytosine deaminase [Phreatobacter stygius]|uniref:Cytosine deaminase n=1 Tax=Phreatobacter stygius TaxID=1940610 RepID=A0A4D7AUS7_9HYPH|nr:cytosine deaminase [Phreatobacter stygius]QCI64649.1 cytosine deaminase [Phreatobacter stygius]
MGLGFASLPDSGRYRLANATVPAALVGGATLDANGDGLALADIVITDGRIETIGVRSAADAATDLATVDLDRAMVFPCFVDSHTHLDKGHIWPRAANPDGTFPGALAAVAADRQANWSAVDVRTRMNFGLRSAFAHGTAAIRTHIDSLPGQIDISWPLFSELRQEWLGRIDLQASSLCGIDVVVEDGYLDKLVPVLKRFGGGLGCVTYMSPNLAEGLEQLFSTALAQGFKLDFHVDETLDAGAHSLRLIAEAALRFGWAENGNGRIVVGHCCSLSAQADDEVERTLDLVAKAGLAVVSLPMCNMYLQDRSFGRTPRRRGVTLLHEMKQRGTPVMVASDNTRDPFYAYGDLDVLEVYRAATRILHFDHPVGDWPLTVTGTPAEACGFSGRGLIAAGLAADLVLFRGRTWTELLARPEADRTVIRAGRAIDTTLPCYRDLDVLWS